jgi:hypothetical protein
MTTTARKAPVTVTDSWRSEMTQELLENPKCSVNCGMKVLTTPKNIHPSTAVINKARGKLWDRLK